MKKTILKIDLHDGKDKQKAMKAVSTLHGIDSMAMDMKEKKMTVIGSVDPVDLVNKLRKSWPTNIFSVGPAKEPEKKVAAKKEEPHREENKKKKEEEKDLSEQILNANAYKAYYNPYFLQSLEENPNSCVIC